MNLNKLKKLSGDASYRIFFRNKIFLKNKLIAPKLIKNGYIKNYIEIEDFGDTTVFQLLKKNNSKKLFYYKKIILLLNKIQKIKTKKIKTFLNQDFKIPNYSKKILLNEANLFLQWYLPKFIIGKKKIILKKKLSKILKSLLNQLSYKKNVFVHRDFHVSNIMITKRGFGIIDSQDALFGNIAYDLASLIDDVRIKTTKKLKDNIYNEFIIKNKSLDKYKFQNDFEILSVLRNLKIIGIFSRLSKRDKKNKYLKLIPYAWKLIESRYNNNKKFNELKIILEENFPKKIRTYEN